MSSIPKNKNVPKKSKGREFPVRAPILKHKAHNQEFREMSLSRLNPRPGDWILRIESTPDT